MIMYNSDVSLSCLPAREGSCDGAAITVPATVVVAEQSDLQCGGRVHPACILDMARDGSACFGRVGGLERRSAPESSDTVFGKTQ